MIWVIPQKLENIQEEWRYLNHRSDKVLWELSLWALVWSIWLERNDAVFNQKDTNTEVVWDMHILRVAWWVKAYWKRIPYQIDQFRNSFELIRIPSKSKLRKKTVWSPPQSGVVKFNVDGSALGSPGETGIGGVLRNARREIIGFFSLSTGPGFAYEAEVYALHFALLICQLFVIRNVVLESDSMVAVSWVNNKKNRPWKLQNYLNHIDHLAKEVNCLQIKHVMREANVLADYLAKRGSSQALPICCCCNSILF